MGCRLDNGTQVNLENKMHFSYILVFINWEFYFLWKLSEISHIHTIKYYSTLKYIVLFRFFDI